MENEDVVENHPFEEEDPQGGFDAFFCQFLPLDKVKVVLPRFFGLLERSYAKVIIFAWSEGIFGPSFGLLGFFTLLSASMRR